MSIKKYLIKMLLGLYSLFNKNTNNRKGMYSFILKLYRKNIESYYNTKLSNAHIDDEGRICIGKKPVSELLFHNLCNKKYVERIVSIKHKLKQTLMKHLEDKNANHRDILKAYMDYESLMLDQLIDYNKIPHELLVLRSGRYSYLQLEMFNLLHQGHQLANKNNQHTTKYTQWDDEWYAEYVLCNYFISFEILKKFNTQMVDEAIKKNCPRFQTEEETWNAIMELHREMMCYGAAASSKYDSFIRTHPKMKQYAVFVSEAMEYNDELKILRSRAIYRFLKTCTDKKLNTLTEILKVIRMR